MSSVLNHSAGPITENHDKRVRIGVACPGRHRATGYSTPAVATMSATMSAPGSFPPGAEFLYWLDGSNW
jgi:hypothetical protein